VTRPASSTWRSRSKASIVSSFEDAISPTCSTLPFVRYEPGRNALQRARPALLLDVEHRPARSRRRWALRLDDGTLFTVTTTAAYAVRAVRAGV